MRDVICAQPFATASSPTSVMSMYFSGKPDFRGEYGVGSEVRGRSPTQNAQPVFAFTTETCRDTVTFSNAEKRTVVEFARHTNDSRGKLRV